MEKLKKVENWRISEIRMRRTCASESRKASQDAIVRNLRSWQRWKKRAKMSYALMTSLAKNCRGMQCVKLVNKN